MKKILLILVIALCNLFTIYAQDVINPPKFDFFTTSTGGYDTLVTRNFNHFYLSWKWDTPGRKLDDALGIIYYHDNYNCKYDISAPFTDSNKFIPYHRKVTQLPYITGGRKHNLMLNAQSMYYFPVIETDSTDLFTPRPYDSSGAVFGWNYKDINLQFLDSSQHLSDDFLPNK